MSFEQIIAFLAPFEALLKPELLALEATGMAELRTMIEGASSPDLKLALTLLANAADAFAKAEIAKL